MGRKICNYTLAILFSLSGYAFAGDKVTGNETVSGTLAVTGASTLSGGATVGSLNGIVKASSGSLGTATADTDYSVPNGTETLTNKTFDTAGTGNVFKIGGVSITGLYGNTAKLVAGSGTLTSGTCAQFDVNGNVVTTGSSCASSGSVLGGSIIGTSNEVVVSTNSNTVGSNVTLSLPQAIATGSSPTFAGLTLSGLTASEPVFTGSGKALASGSLSGNTTELATVTGALTNGDFAYFDASGNVKDSGSSASTFAPATSGQAILYGNNAGGTSNVTIGTGLSFTGGNLSQSGAVGVPASKSFSNVYGPTTTDGFVNASCNEIPNQGVATTMVLAIGTTSGLGTTICNVSEGSNNTQQPNPTCAAFVPKGYYYEVTVNQCSSNNIMWFTSLGS